MFIIVGVYIFLSLLIAFQGHTKRIGFVNALLFSLLLTPITGVFVVLFSKNKYPKRIRKSKRKKGAKYTKDDDI